VHTLANPINKRHTAPSRIFCSFFFVFSFYLSYKKAALTALTLNTNTHTHPDGDASLSVHNCMALASVCVFHPSSLYFFPSFCIIFMNEKVGNLLVVVFSSCIATLFLSHEYTKSSYLHCAE